jgi:hypothetical protein
MRLVRPPDRLTHVAFLVAMGIRTIVPGDVDLGAGNKRMLPDLVTSCLTNDVPAGPPEVCPQFSQLRRHRPLSFPAREV